MKYVNFVTSTILQNFRTKIGWNFVEIVVYAKDFHKNFEASNFVSTIFLADLFSKTFSL